MDVIEYQVKVKHHVKSIQILDAIIQAEKRQANQKEWVKTTFGQWQDKSKSLHQIEITDMAIKRLNQWYINHINELTK